jgi:glycosyltransferase involved in cell wall biosynthesis
VSLETVLAVPLGEISAKEVTQLVEQQFGSVKVEWFDRGELRRRPLQAMWRLFRKRDAHAVLVARDLRQPRLRLTSLMLALTRANRRWRIDVGGNREAWSTASHLAANALPIARHLLACGLALAFGRIALRAIDRGIQRRANNRGAQVRAKDGGIQSRASDGVPRGIVDGGVDSREHDRGVQSSVNDRGIQSRAGDSGVHRGTVDAGVHGREHDHGGQSRGNDRGVEGGENDRHVQSRAIDGGRQSRENDPGVHSCENDSGVHSRARDQGLQSREHKPSTPNRWLYLRSQLWLGLEGGGSVAHTAGVIGGLRDAGVDVTVVSSDRLPGVAAPTQIVPPEMWFDGWLREVEDLAYNVAFFVAALKVASRFSPDAIYQRHTAFNCCGAVLSRVLRVPLVLEFNSSEVWKGRHWGGLRMTRWAAGVERINLRAANRVIVVSEVQRDELVRGGVPASKVVVNPNAVDPRVFRPEAGGADVRRRLGLGSEVVIGFSGTFGEWHGIPTLAAALPLVLDARPHARWLLIGDGPLRGIIENVVKSHGLDERVQRVGMVRHAEMPAYLAACDILVSPHGRQADGGEFFGSPTKLFEYMASGRPIVASAVGQIAEVLADDGSALLVAPNDAEALAAAVIRLIDDACLRARLGQAARLAAEQHHTWRQNAERVLDCLGAA